MRILLLCFVSIMQSVSYYMIEAERIGIYKEEDCLELDRQIKVLNKPPPIRSFQNNKDGGIIDCIDINKQPAFDHPLLKNHTIQLQPSSLPRGMVTAKSKSVASSRRKGVECPAGTVPIRRTTKEDLVRAKSLSSLYHAKVHFFASKARYQQQGHYFATAGTIVNKNRKYYGSSAEISIYNETVSTNQFSGAGLWLINRLNGHMDAIHYGWTVNPKLNGDHLTRTTAFWTAGNRGCFNLLCPGFVQVDPNHHLGEELKQQSVSGGDQYVLMPLIYKDPKTGNWWLLENKDGPVAIGYWPGSLFTGLANSASEIRFGGEAYSPSNELPPTMGSGHYQPTKFEWSGFVSHIQFVDDKNQPYDPKDIDMGTLTSNSKCYNVQYLGDTGSGYGYTMLYGGAGGAACE